MSALIKTAAKPELREVVLHGELARRYGKVHHLAVNSAAEAVRALAANHKGFEQHLAQSHQRGVGYNVWVNGQNCTAQETQLQSNGRIYISPVVMGSKRGGIFQAILGVVLIVVGVVLSVGSYGALSELGAPLIGSGLSLLVGGVMQLLAGTPSQDGTNTLKSAFFNGPANTTAQGNPVPVGYGRLIVGSAIISAGISVDDDSNFDKDVYQTTHWVLVDGQFRYSPQPQQVLVHAADHTKDGLKSTAYAQIVDLVCEGEIEGFPTNESDPRAMLQHIYLDGTPVFSAGTDTSNPANYNVPGITVDFRYGTNDQPYLAGFSDVENEITVNAQVLHDAPLVRTISDATIDSVRVTLSVPSLFVSGDGISGTSVEYKIEVQSNGGGYVSWTSPTRTISGKSAGKFQRSHLIGLRDYGPAPYDIRVTRMTADSTDVTVSNKLYWDSYTQIVDAKLRYPNSALFALKFDSSYFDHIPTRGYDLKLLKVQVPSNYDPIARTYTGAWDGTFKIAWTDNPAWCFYDLVTSERYGLGLYISAAQVDKWALYSIAQYCDALVPDGRGGTEPRFTCNVYLQKRQDAYTCLTQMASIFRGMMFWGGGALVAVQDAPADAVALYTNANVVNGDFNYEGASQKARHTVALVQWNDPSNLYQQQIEYVEDAAGIARYGIVQSQVVAVGCTSRGQANRVGRWLLYSERMESETCTFTVGLEGIMARPGQIIEVADAHRAGARLGGRILAATTTDITLDAPVTLEPGISYTLSVIAPGGAIAEAPVQAVAVETTTSTLTVTSAYATAPNPGAIWVLASSAVEPQTMRVIGVTEPEPNLYAITAIRHEPTKYDQIETGLVVIDNPISTLQTPLAAPTNFTVEEWADTAQGGIVRNDLVFSWDAVPGAAKYALTYQINDDTPVTVYPLNPSYNVIVHQSGPIIASVQPINAVGVGGLIAEATTTTIKPAPIPPQPWSFSISMIDGDQGGPSPVDATKMRGSAQYATVSDEPENLRNTNLLLVTNGFSTLTMKAANNAGYQFEALGTLQVKTINQYGNESALLSLSLPPNPASIYRGGPPTYDNTIYPFHIASFFSATQDSDSVTFGAYTPSFAATLTGLSWAKVSGDSFTVSTPIGSPLGGPPFSSIGSQFSYPGLSIGDTKSAIYTGTFTFSSGATVNIDYSVVVTRIDGAYGYKPH